MGMILSQKTECFPSPEQKHYIEKCFGLRRFFFNKALMTLKKKYGNLKESRSKIKKKEVDDFRKNLFRAEYYPWVRSVSFHVMDSALLDLNQALGHLWEKGKEIKLRSKKSSNTFRIFASGVKEDGTNASFKYEPDLKYVKLPKMGWLKIAETLRWERAIIKTATIKKEAGRYFISLSVDIPDADAPKRRKKTNKHLGIDWGLKTYITAFDGEDVLTADFDEKKLKKLDKKIAKNQKSLVRKKVNSNNWVKAKTKLQQSYLDFDNYRHSYVKQLVYDIDQAYDSVTLEALGMSFVTRNRKLAHRAKQKPFYLLKETLVKKFSITSKAVYQTPKGYPSTQLCSACGRRKEGKDKLKLKDKKYTCSACGLVIDRDENAARNIWECRGLELATLED